MSPFDLEGAAELLRRIGEFAGKEGLPAEPRRRLEGLVGRYTRRPVFECRCIRYSDRICQTGDGRFGELSVKQDG